MYLQNGNERQILSPAGSAKRVPTWGCSSAGRAPALQAGGQEFDSPHLHQGRTEDKPPKHMGL